MNLGCGRNGTVVSMRRRLQSGCLFDLHLVAKDPPNLDDFLANTFLYDTVFFVY